MIETVKNNKFRKTVGIVVEFEGKILIAETNKKNWGMPQGGVEGFEGSFEAAKRELYEETKILSDLGEWTESCEWIFFSLDKYKRDGEKYTGQIYKWFLYRLYTKPTISLSSSEFTGKYKWASPLECIEIANLKKDLYKKVFTEFDLIDEQV